MSYPPPPPGWYPDPHGGPSQRYWDGGRWTEHVAAPQMPAYGQPMAWQPAPKPQFAGRLLADWWPRVGASILDSLLVAVPAFVVGFVIGAAESHASSGARQLGGAVAGLLIGALYNILLMQREGEHNGQTLGMQATGIRVIRTDGRPVEAGLILLRQTLVKGVLFGWVSIVLLYIPTLLNYLWPLWDGQNRALHDMMCSTRVVRAGPAASAI